jgi:ribosomal protein L32
LVKKKAKRRAHKKGGVDLSAIPWLVVCRQIGEVQQTYLLDQLQPVLILS